MLWIASHCEGCCQRTSVLCRSCLQCYSCCVDWQSAWNLYGTNLCALKKLHRQWPYTVPVPIPHWDFLFPDGFRRTIPRVWVSRESVTPFVVPTLSQDDLNREPEVLPEWQLQIVNTSRSGRRN
jgi:hypothetical protein